MTLAEFVGARLHEEQQQAQKLMRLAQDTHLTLQDHKRFLGRDIPGWWAWPDVEQLCARTLADSTAKRAILELHAQIPCVNCEAKGRTPATSCWRCHHGDTDQHESYYDGTCSTIRALAQPYAEHPEFDPSWKAD